MLKAVIFDFDGTIADTLPVCVDAFRQTVEPILGRALSLDDVRTYFGPSEEGVFQKHFPESADELLQIYYERYAALQAEGSELAPGILDLLRELKARGIRIALVTAKGAVTCQISLDYYGIADLFEQVAVGSPTGRVKADQIAQILQSWGVEKSEAVYVGDSPKDAISAHKAGVEAWGAAWFPSAEPEKMKETKFERIFYSVDDMRACLPLDARGSINQESKKSR